MPEISTGHLYQRRIAQPALHRVSANLVLASYLDLAQAPSNTESPSL